MCRRVIVPSVESTRTIAVTFPGGLPGFEDRHRFQLIEHPDLAPLHLLQSEECAELCFLAIPCLALDPGYELALTETDRAVLGASDTDLLSLAILTIPAEGPPRANLLAPVVIDRASGVGVQAVREDQKYSHQHPLPEVLPCS
jgi:flagellar assembly factor FliW